MSVRLFFIAFSLLLLPSPGFAQGYTTWLTGNATDVQTEHEFGVVLGGGGGDNDDAMRWMLQRAAGGDVVVLRTSGADGYNDYFFNELNVSVNSVRTIRFDQPTAVQDTLVADWIRAAEVVFLAGGDQSEYVAWWQNTPVMAALNYVLTEKRGTVGGTSAGMAVLGQLYFSAAAGTVHSDESLADPFNPFLDAGLVDTADFLQTPFLENTITDTHWADREREGRTVTFLARLSAARGQRTFAIACNEYTALTVDSLGIARVYGEAPQYPDYAHFLAVNCQDDFLPEMLAAQTPLDWQRGGAAVKVYRVPGTTTGANFLDLTDWSTGSGGQWQNWSVEAGTLQTSAVATSDCAETTTSTGEQALDDRVRIFPQPASDWMQLQTTAPLDAWSLHNVLGQAVLQGTGKSIHTQELPAGTYYLKIGARSYPITIVTSR